jgi:hypothetical protein
MSEVTPKTDLICEAGALVWGDGADPAEWVGGLVEWSTGSWGIVEGVYSDYARKPAPNKYFGIGNRELQVSECKPLLPRRPADPAEQKAAMIAAGWQDPQWADMWSIQLAKGDRWTEEIRGYWPGTPEAEQYPPYFTHSGVGGCDDPDILDKASNRLRALRVWLAQPAKEVA